MVALFLYGRRMPARSEPSELIAELRQAARFSGLDEDAVPVVEQVEWEAADFIAAAMMLLERVALAGGEFGPMARQLLDGDYPVAPDDGMPLDRWD